MTDPHLATSVAPTPSVPYRGATDAATADWWAGQSLRIPSWGIPDWIVSVGLWLLFSLIGSVPLALAVAGTVGYSWALVVGVVLPWIGLAGWPWLVSRLRGNGMVADYGLRVRRADIGWGLLYGLASLVAAAVVGGITIQVFGEFESSAGDVANDMSDFPLALLIFALAVGFGAPIVEEICYRGLLMGGLLKRGRAKWVAVVLSAALFAGMHLEPIRFPLLFAVGLILGLARVHRNNTTTPIVAHMTNNIPGAIAIVLLAGS